MFIALMRHGQTNWNLEGRIQGRTNIPLNDTGRQQIREAARAIAQNGNEWRRITSSPLDRALESARIAADELSLTLNRPHDGLVEQNYGEAEGITVDELQERWPDRNIPGGETPKELASRALRTMDELAELHDGEPLLAVTHGAYIRRLIATIADLEYQAVPRILNASVSTFEHDGTSWVIRTVNNENVNSVLTPTPAFTMMNAGTGFGTCTTDGVCS